MSDGSTTATTVARQLLQQHVLSKKWDNDYEMMALFQDAYYYFIDHVEPQLSPKRGQEVKSAKSIWQKMKPTHIVPFIKSLWKEWKALDPRAPHFREKYHCKTCLTMYQKSLPVCGVILETTDKLGDKVLLVRSAGVNRLSFPKGKLNLGKESKDKCARRELKEETGIDFIDEFDPISIEMNYDGRTVSMFSGRAHFSVQHVSKVQNPFEIAEIRWTLKKDITPAMLTHRDARIWKKYVAMKKL